MSATPWFEKLSASLGLGVRKTSARRRSRFVPRIEDLEDRLLLATAVWDGGGGNNNWTTAANWVGDLAPAAGDDLVFSGNVRPTANNDFAVGTNFSSITVTDGGFNLTGNSVNLTGSTAITVTQGTVTFTLPVTFQNDTSVDIGNDVIVNVNGLWNSGTAGSRVVTLDTINANDVGQVNLNAAIGGVAALQGFNSTAGVTTRFNQGGISTVASQNYAGPVILGANTTFTSTAAGNILFGSSINSADSTPRTLAINTAGLTRFGDGTGPDQVGGAFALQSVTTDEAGATQFMVAGSTNAAPTILTVGSQTYNDIVRLRRDTVLANTAVSADTAITFNNTVDSYDASGRSLTINTRSATNIGNGGADYVGRLFPLLSFSTDTDVPLNMAGGGLILNVANSNTVRPTIQTTGDQTYNDAISLSLDTVLQSTMGGEITVNDTIDSTPPAMVIPPAMPLPLVRRALTINSSGNKQYNGQIGGTNELLRFISDGDGTTTFNFAGSPNNASVTTREAQFYGDDVILQDYTVLTINNNSMVNTFDIRFTGSINSFSNAAQNLYVNTLGGTYFGDGVGNDSIGSVFAVGAFGTDINMAKGGTTHFNIINASNATPTVTTLGTQVYGDQIRLLQNSVFTSTSSNDGGIWFQQRVDSGDGQNVSLVVNALEDVVFGDGMDDDRVGGRDALMSFISDDDAGLGVGGSTVFNVISPVDTGASLRTVDFQIYKDAVEIDAETVLTSTNAGMIHFRSTIDSLETDSFGNSNVDPSGLAVNTGGITRFGDGMGTDLVGGNFTLNTLITDGSGATQFFISGGTTATPSVLTVGIQSYGDIVRLARDTVLTSTSLAGGNISFDSTVDSYNTTFKNLEINTLGQAIFGDGVGTDLVGRTFALNNLTVNGGVQLNSLGTTSTKPTVTTVGTQIYGTMVLQQNSSLFSSGGADININGSINSSFAGPRSLAVRTTGNTVFGDGIATDNIGDVAALGSLTTDAGGTTFFRTGTGQTKTVNTTGSQTYNDTVRLRSNTVFNSTAGGTLAFNAAVNSFDATQRSIALNTTGNVNIGDGVGDDRFGGVNQLLSLATDTNPSIGVGGKTIFNVTGAGNATPTVRTSGGQSYAEAVVLNLDTVLTSTNSGNIEFRGTINSATTANPRSLTVNTAGFSDFGDGLFDFIGNIAPLRTITTDAPGTSRLNIGGSTNSTPSIRTTMGQTFNDLVLLRSDIILTNPNLNQILLNGGVNQGGFQLFFSNNPNAASSFSGFFTVPTGQTRVFQSGNSLTFVDEFNVTTQGQFTSSTTLTGRGGLTGTVQPNGDIVWSDGVVWTRTTLGGEYDGSDGTSFTIVQSGVNFTLTTDTNVVIKGQMLSNTDLVLFDGNNTRAVLSGNQIIFPDGRIFTLSTDDD